MDDFCAARTGEIPALLWPNFAPPYTTRERIFFNRLSFDLMIAAARVGYHLHIYEPNVDRDGFDIIVEDEDSTRQLQTRLN